MFRIGEFSKLMQVSIRMLRYYDETGLLKPAEIDKDTGYRMYSIEQIPVLNRIIYLRDSGFQVAEIADALEKEEHLLIEQLDRKYAQIEAAIQTEQEKLRKIALAKKEIQADKSEMHYHIATKSVESCNVLSLRRVISDYYAEGALWNELSQYAGKNKINISSLTFTIYHDKEYKETDVDVELCAPVSKFGVSTGEFQFRTIESVPLMASTMVYGPFSNIAGAYIAFAEWLQQNSRYRMNGGNRQIVHRGPWNESNPDKYLVELQIPLEQK